MAFGRRQRGSHALLIEITPMIDVVFLLIIFFMAAARFAQETRAALELPVERGEQQESAEEAGLIVNIQSDGTIIVDQRERSLDDLEEIVQREIGRVRGRDPKHVKLLLRADRGGDSARLNEVLERLQTLGVGAARLATEQP